MKLLPFAVIYGGLLNTNVILSSLNNVHTATVAQLALQIAEVNTNYSLYGFNASPAIPSLPAIPTMTYTAPQAIAYFQSQPNTTSYNHGPSTSFLLIDADTANGFDDPNNALNGILTDANLVAISAAARALRANITTQPTAAVTIAHNASGNLGTVVASGAGNTFQWQYRLLGTGAWLNVPATGPFSNVTTATLTIANPVLVTYDQTVFRCVVQSTGSGPVCSSSSTLTVT
jgi:hypothetical protein